MKVYIKIMLIRIQKRFVRSVLDFLIMIQVIVHMKNVLDVRIHWNRVYVSFAKVMVFMIKEIVLVINDYYLWFSFCYCLFYCNNFLNRCKRLCILPNKWRYSARKSFDFFIWIFYVFLLSFRCFGKFYSYSNVPNLAHVAMHMCCSIKCFKEVHLFCYFEYLISLE